MEEIKLQFRYPGGGYSFLETDESIFCGRSIAINYIYSAVQLNPSVVIYGKSGIGKSSLLQAGVIPIIMHANNDANSLTKFQVYTTRTGIWQRHESTRLTEKIRDMRLWKGSIRETRSPFLPFLDDTIKQSLWYKFKSLQFDAAEDNGQDVFLVIFDQVEEIFTYPANEIADIITELSDLRSPILPEGVSRKVEEIDRAYRKQLETSRQEGNETQIKPPLSELESAILYKPLPVKFIFAVRSDKSYLLGRLKKAIPSIQQNTFELFPFSADQAREAILKPSMKDGIFHSKKFDLSGVCEMIVEFLLAQPVEELEYQANDCRIDPFALQVICRHIEKMVIDSKEEPPVKITSDMIGDLNSILVNFYTNTLLELKLDPSEEIKVRQLLEEKMIYEQHRRRLPLIKEIILSECNMDPNTFEILLESRLIKETAPGSNSYEISHDSLIGPILDAKKQRKQQEEELKKKYDAFSRETTKELNAVERDNDNTNPYEYLRKKAEHSYANQNYSEALDYYQKAIERKKNFDEELYIGAANCLFNMAAYEHSNEYFYALRDRNPYDIYVLYSIAYNYLMMEDYDHAISYYQQILVLSPMHREAMTDLGVIYRAKREFETALDYFKKVVETYPDEADCHLLIIEMQIGLQRFDNIGETVARLLATMPAGQVYFNIARVYNKHGYLQDAADYLKKAVDIDAHNSVYHSQLGITFSYIGKLPEAVEHIQLACLYDPENAYYHTWLGFLYRRTGYLDGAIDEFTKATSFDDSYRYAAAALAACYHAKGNEVMFKQYVDIARSLPAADAEDDYSRASFEALCGNKEQALAYLQSAMLLGLRDVSFAEEDPDFMFIKSEPAFRQIIQEAKQKTQTAPIASLVDGYE